MKGAEKVTWTLITALIAIGLFVVIILFFANYYIQTNVVIKSNDVERHGIVLGNLLLTSDKLSFTNGKTLYRDVFSKDKLDNEMVNLLKLVTYKNIFSDSDIFKEISYPNSMVFLYVTDLDTNERWFLIGHGPLTTTEATDWIGCFGTKLRLDPQAVGRFLISIPALSNPATAPAAVLNSLWDAYDFSECEHSLSSQVGTTTQTFPVAIRISDTEIHEGILSVGLREL